MFTGYIRDITDRRRAAETEILRREKEAAEAANSLLSALLRNRVGRASNSVATASTAAAPPCISCATMVPGST
jgi:hypothetical protein